MAKSHPNTALLLFFFPFLLLLQSPSSSSSSAARLLIGNPAENLAAAAADEPALLNLVLPGVVDVVISDLQAVRTSPEEDSPAGAGERYLRCGSGSSSRRQVGATGFQALRLCGKGGQLLMSMLPKGGGVPPSAPSRRTNGNNN
ncbi:hypothetical protein TorRG33x02_176010 [Trema orientale]|uniref:Uncharacterized protein n=1 Tax=Trema orientale TaxID=63057 RepID=A0A2P5ELV3_TREOI|nr:hypothetical protein TorRG33x02_176010 [Trema orientale]